ncbi:MAG: hypothetical protein ACOZJZ_06780 [Pseudomonadota bacterium]
MTTHRIPHIPALLLAAAAAMSANAWAAGTTHDHGPAHATAAKPLPAGQRWATDAPLREGMGRIRAALEPQLKAVHHDKLGAEEYKALAAQTEQQVAHIVANCKLAPEADAALHGILAQIGEATEAMAGKSKAKPRDGAVKLVAALEEYGRSFDHPGWKKLHR